MIPLFWRCVSIANVFLQLIAVLAIMAMFLAAVNAFFVFYCDNSVYYGGISFHVCAMRVHVRDQSSERVIDQVC